MNAAEKMEAKDGFMITAVVRKQIPIIATITPKVCAITLVDPNQSSRKAAVPISSVRMTVEISEINAAPATPPKMLPAS